jgi:hypothetical protein
MSERSVAASVERLHAIADGIRQVLGNQRWWITPEEFLENVEAHRRKYDREQRNPKAVNHEPATIREYQLKRFFIWNRQMEFREVAK